MLDRRLVLACAMAASVSPARSQQPMPVVASFSILGDMARQIGGARVAVSDIVGPGQDPHGFQPSPADVKKMAAARVVIVNGLGVDSFVERLLRQSGQKRQPIVASAGVDAIVGKADAHGHGHKAGSDPHCWQSVMLAKLYAKAIAAALVAADPEGAKDYETRLTDYLAKLDVLDQDVRAAIGAIPPERRVLTTTHDSFAYFAREYGLKVQALHGVSTDSEPSAADMARIIRQLKSLKSPAVFLENVTDPRKISEIARESGAKVGGTLYSDALSLADGPAATYIDMMRHNVRQIAEALKP